MNLKVLADLDHRPGMTLRLAVWGLGRHAVNKILPAVAEASGLELYGLCSRDAARVADCSAEWKCRGWTDAAAMLADPETDVVYVATPIGLHAQHGRRVLEAGKHLWCEKPLTCGLDTTLQLLALSRTRGLSICEGHMYLHHPQFAKLADYVSSGKLGEILSVDCRFGIPRLDYASFRSNPDLCGGALYDVGSYPVSAILALFPQNHRVVYSRLTTRSGSPVDTDGVALIELVNGAVAHLEWRINCAYRNEIAVWGDAASVFSDRIFSKSVSYVPMFRLLDTHGHETAESGNAADHFVAMLEAFRVMTEAADEAERERSRIEGRATLLEQISASHIAKAGVGT